MEQHNYFIIFKTLGALFVVAGLLFLFMPDLLRSAPVPNDTFAAIERRIPWGAVLGFGLLLIAQTSLKPWGLTIASIGFWLTLGILLARVVGLFLDGMDNRQWMWVGVELLIVIIAGFFIARFKSWF